MPIRKPSEARVTIASLRLPPDDMHLLEDIARVMAARRDGRKSRTAPHLLVTGGSACERGCIAAAVADAIGTTLVRFDAAGVVSHYIGETEQSLQRLLDTATETDAVLLFDEADALMGRAAVSSPRLSATLLRMIERHRGDLVVGASQRALLDAAFLRRLDVFTEFLVPDPAMREGVWREAFPACADAADPDREK